MKVHSHHLAALFYSMAVLTACAPQAQQAPRAFAPVPSSSLDVINRADIASSKGTTAYEVVARARPMYLVSRVDLAPNAEREVFLNGVRLGGVDQLRYIAASEVKEIRFVRAIDGAAHGVGRTGGAILVFSRAGR